MTVESLRAFLRNVRTTEMTEPYFSHLVVIVEGPSEREALPIFATNAGLDFDEHGISVVSANGKTTIDTLVHLYAAHGIRSYVIFDNDAGKTLRTERIIKLCVDYLNFQRPIYPLK